MENWLGTTLSVMAGGMLTMLSNWLADRRLSRRDQERRREERQERMAARRNEFQRETLLALQVASQKLLRNTGASLHQDTVAYRTTGVWQKQLLPDGLSDDHLHHMTDTMLLASRIRDDEVRNLADKLRSQVTTVFMSSGEQAAQRDMLLAAETQQALIQRIGRLVRELDEIAA